MATWLIIVLGIYCGITYGVAAMLWMISGEFRLRHVFDFLLSPLLGIAFVGVIIWEAIREYW